MPKIEVRCALEDFVRTLTAISRLMAGLCDFSSGTD